MRIISGEFKGRFLHPPKGLPVRPTTDFAKTGLFNILSNRIDFGAVSVLDLFCGTGSISFEFASRGVNRIVSVDKHPGCLKFIKETCSLLGIKSIHTIKADSFKFVNNCSEKFDIIFADPPFELETTGLLPDLVFKNDSLVKSGLLIVEHQSKRKLQSHIQPKEIRLYGNVAFSIYSFDNL